jgi:hypothetical protein
MKIKTSELTGAALDWAVANCERVDHLFAGHEVGRLHYSSTWAEGGPIIEREWISVWQVGNKYWKADIGGLHSHNGATPLIAAMRCYVASKLGGEVDVPDELTNQGETSC